MDPFPLNWDTASDGSPPPPTPPPSPSRTSKLRGRHVSRRSHFRVEDSSDDADENLEEEKKERRMWSRLLRQQQPPPLPPTERVLRPRRQAVVIKKRKEEEAEEVKENRTMKKKKSKPAASVALALTKEEIADDFVAFTGSKPPRWPKLRRNSNLQMRLNKLFPGICLQRTITRETYGVRDGG